MNQRTCKHCDTNKPLDAFDCLDRKKGWYRGVCKECRSRQLKNWAERSKEHIIATRRAYYQANRDHIVRKAVDWGKANPEKRRKNALSYYYRLQDAAIMAYGGYRCVWCGINEPLVLCIDHVNNDGREHRREIGSTGGHRFYKWLADHDYPEGFQVLCMNCNHAKYRNRGVLPETLLGRCNDHPERE